MGMRVVLMNAVSHKYLRDLESDRTLKNEDTSHFMACCTCNRKVKLFPCTICGEKMLCNDLSCKTEHQKTCIVSECPPDYFAEIGVNIMEGEDSPDAYMVGSNNGRLSLPSAASLLGTILVRRSVVPTMNKSLMVHMRFGNMVVRMAVTMRLEHIKCIDDKIRTRSQSFDAIPMAGNSLQMQDLIPFPVGRHYVSMHICYIQA
jgi:hypothetical protein